MEQQIRWHGTYGDAPMPNAIVFTGSGGCHLYYIFEELPNGKKGRMAEGIQAVKMQLLARWVQIEKTLQDEGLDFHVDTQAIDASRVFRIPGSIHRDTGRMCWMKPLRSTPYGYKELCRCLSDAPWKETYAVANAHRDIERVRFGYGQSDRRSEPCTMTKQFLGAKRLRELLRLAHAGWGFQDCRELAAHFAWLWGRDAEFSEDGIRDKLGELNTCFYQPISERELFYTARGNGKSYRYTNSRIRLALGLDGSEGYFTGRRSREYKNRAGKTRLHKKMDCGAGAGGKENPGDRTGTAPEYLPCETPPDRDEEGRGLRLLVGRSHLSDRKPHRKTARLLRNRSGLAVVRKTGEKAGKRETKCISAGYQTDRMQPLPQNVRFGLYIISSPLENGSE